MLLRRPPVAEKKRGRIVIVPICNILIMDIMFAFLPVIVWLFLIVVVPSVAGDVCSIVNCMIYVCL